MRIFLPSSSAGMGSGTAVKRPILLRSRLKKTASPLTRFSIEDPHQSKLVLGAFRLVSGSRVYNNQIALLMCFVLVAVARALSPVACSRALLN